MTCSTRFLVKDPGNNRLSHQRHYHGPGGLNGRVRNGNGCGPASMVAGKVPSRRSSRAGHNSGVVSHTKAHTGYQNEWRTAPRTVTVSKTLESDQITPSLAGSAACFL